MRVLMLAGALMLAVAPAALAQTGETPPTLDGAKTVTAAEAKALIDKGALALDARAAKGFAEGHLPKAKAIRAHRDDATKEFAAAAFGPDKNAAIVIYGHGSDGWTAVEAVKGAVKHGYKQVNWMRGGFAEWTKAGLPVEK
jgi:rhodanese-related sulfurtransferase